MRPQTVNAPLTVRAGHGRAVRLNEGEAVQVVNTYGTQVVDCWAWNAYNLDEWMSMEATRVWSQRLNPAVGDSFVTNQRHPILTLIDYSRPSTEPRLWVLDLASGAVVVQVGKRIGGGGRRHIEHGPGNVVCKASARLFASNRKRFG